MKRTKKIERFTYQIINFKLISDYRKGTDAYMRIFEDIYSNSIHVGTTAGKRVILRLMYSAKYGKNTFYYGNISRFTDIDKTGDWLDMINKEKVKVDIPDDVYPNLQETSFVMIPQAHRFVIRKSPEFTVFNAYDFLNAAIKRVIRPDEDYNLSIEQSADAYEQIYRALRVEKLTINISYTNSDNIDEEAADWMDDELQLAQAKEVTLQFEAPKKESLNLDSKLVKGSLELAKENGNAEALIYDIDNRRKTIKTKKYPKEVKSSAPNEDEIKNKIFTEIMAVYRPNETLDT